MMQLVASLVDVSSLVSIHMDDLGLYPNSDFGNQILEAFGVSASKLNPPPTPEKPINAEVSKSAAIKKCLI